MSQDLLESNLLSPYAPVRYRGATWWQYSRKLAKAGRVTPDGVVSPEVYEQIDREYKRPARISMLEGLQEEGIQDSDGVLEAEICETADWVVMAAQFERCGREIFELNDRLVAAFRETDLGNTTLEDWHTPYPAFYLRFGKQEHLKLEYGDAPPDSEFRYEYLDGAFVAVEPAVTPHTGLHIRIGMTVVHENESGSLGPGYSLDFPPSTQTMLIEDAIDVALSMRYARLESKVQNTAETRQSFNYRLKERLTVSAELLRRGARLIFNSLFYIESLVERPKCFPGRDVPEVLRVKWDSSNSRQREKLRSKLSADGFTVVRLLGREFREDGDDSGELVPTGATKRTHWRRAHWRQQACGEGLQQRKRIRIPKQLINRDRMEDEIPGHIYKAPE